MKNINVINVLKKFIVSLLQLGSQKVRSIQNISIIPAILFCRLQHDVAIVCTLPYRENAAQTRSKRRPVLPSQLFFLNAQSLFGCADHHTPHSPVHILLIKKFIELLFCVTGQPVTKYDQGNFSKFDFSLIFISVRQRTELTRLIRDDCHCGDSGVDGVKNVLNKMSIKV